MRLPTKRTVVVVEPVTVAAVSVCTVYETVVTELLVMRTLRVPTFARFLRGQAGL